MISCITRITHTNIFCYCTCSKSRIYISCRPNIWRPWIRSHTYQSIIFILQWNYYTMIKPIIISSIISYPTHMPPMCLCMTCIKVIFLIVIFIIIIHICSYYKTMCPISITDRNKREICRT